ncbi:hypothetical protein ACTJKO_11710 [Curtobacterium sp. 22159]|uniref:hypothetical protein n=1 Tax=Curtobacterium sp. 22159 TaxID=3453882 RepID=UPI003F853B0E
MTTGAPRPRPAVVTAAVVLWLALFAFQLVSSSVQIARSVSADGPWMVLPGLVGLAFLAWFVFGAFRVGRGSGRARFWMAVLGALTVIGGFAPPYGLHTLIAVLAGVAAALPYLPAARGFFPPRVPRAAGAQAPRVVGWDPETGEPIRASD